MQHLTAFELLTPENWRDYELLDCGDFEKLERFGEYITIRPEPQAVWHRVLPESDWKKTAHVKFIQKSSNSGEWQKWKKMPDQWRIQYVLPNHQTISFRLGLTSFKHVGVFPEQAANWDYIVKSIASSGSSKPKVLNLFAYTGGASLAASAAGADVTHVDSIKQVVSWARENMELSRLENIRWTVEDALKFVKREERRGSRYNGIILDPPAFGHGPKGEKWKLEENIAEMIESVLKILDTKHHFLILNAYSLGLSAMVIENLLKGFAKNRLHIGELYLQAKSGVKLPLGVLGKFSGIK
ncbi:MAG: class I SAM-dependent methyltransferase [Crocinitomicaceae bacterium]|nr:class I SAM-dependent methyltransferase [Crocinitomicaceae bacterium]